MIETFIKHGIELAGCLCEAGLFLYLVLWGHSRRLTALCLYIGSLLAIDAISRNWILYHYGFRWKAPYALSSLPVLLGTAGGIGLLIGPAGLLWLKAIRDRALSGAKQTGIDVGFLALLLLSSISRLNSEITLVSASHTSTATFDDMRSKSL